MKAVSFDFDSTLEREDVQEYAKWLMTNDVDIFIVTARFDELHISAYSHSGTNEDLFEVTRELGILKNKVYFTNKASKGEWFKGVEKIAWHLDNNLAEVNAINNDTDTVAIHLSGNWMAECNARLNLSRL